MISLNFIDIISDVGPTIINAIAIITTFYVSAKNLNLANKKYQRSVDYQENHDELLRMTNIASKYMSLMSVARLGTFLRKATSSTAVASTDDFYVDISNAIQQIEAVTFEILSIEGNFKIIDDIEKLRKEAIRILNNIGDLKALCSYHERCIEKNPEYDDRNLRGSIGESSSSIYNMLENYQTTFDSIKNQLIVTVKKQAIMVQNNQHVERVNDN